MRKILSYLFAIAVLGIGLNVARAAVQAPLDAEGHALATIDFVGAYPCVINSSTTVTNPIVCTSSMNLPSGYWPGTVNSGGQQRAILYGVIASSLASTNYLVFKDTFNATYSNVDSTVAVIINWQQVNVTSAVAPATNFYKLPVPLIFRYGIQVKADTALTGVVPQWTILWRPLNGLE